MSTPGAGTGGPEVWTIARLLTWMQGYFAEKGIDSPRLDGELLLSHVLGTDRIYLYTHYDQPITAAERDALRELVRRRGRFEPVAYLRGSREFFGRSFKVTPAVLIPRPETEHVVEAALTWARERGVTAPAILDVGTGSGALALTLAAELPEAYVTAIDISPEALDVARDNAAALGVAERVTLLEGDLYAPLPLDASFDLIVSNPPYVASAVASSLPQDVRDFEPSLALFAGPEGMDLLRRLIAGVAGRLRRPGLFACEMGEEQGERVAAALREALPSAAVEVLPDLAGLSRVAVARADAPV
ncbi:MAG TPA: peptide chain release factor N(5)-glutamine methyltransferase [Myxococcota bacterium]|nr:peptide chain release factor N(5)-glutamine methyltransferase [Myxococcota bacterium]